MHQKTNIDCFVALLCTAESIDTQYEGIENKGLKTRITWGKQLLKKAVPDELYL